MSDYDNNNKGAIFKNSYKEEGDNKPDYVGSINVDGKDWRVALWEATSKKGNKYLSVRITEPQEGDSKPSSSNTANDDDIPF
jgi:uncharacterized protein (DUF736 family)|tara:strand:+ start:2523 stop:2768 length:246 start_codon:yes stop_codon:yes gene_type:complete